MKVVQVNVGSPMGLSVGNKTIKTGINKQPCSGPVDVGRLGLEGDAVLNTRHHGGPDQAVYLYSLEDYAFWERQLGRPLIAGCFGENLSTEGLDLSKLVVGDVLRSEKLCLQVTAPRIPCSTFASWMEDRHLVTKFLDARRPGAYCRVLEPGQVEAGDTFHLESWQGERKDLVSFFLDSKRSLQKPALEVYLALPIDERSRADFERQLARISN